MPASKLEHAGSAGINARHMVIMRVWVDMGVMGIVEVV